MSASGKSALCVAQLTDGVFTSELVGNVKVSKVLEVGSEHTTNFKTVTTRQSVTDEGTVFNWLVLGL